MPNETLAQDVRSGLWQNNVGLVQLLGLCPLLAVSTNAVNALALGLASLLALLATSTAISTLRRFIADEVRIPALRHADRCHRQQHRARHARLASRTASRTGHLSATDRDQLRGARARRAQSRKG